MLFLTWKQCDIGLQSLLNKNDKNSQKFRENVERKMREMNMPKPQSSS